MTSRFYISRFQTMIDRAIDWRWNIDTSLFQLFSDLRGCFKKKVSSSLRDRWIGGRDSLRQEEWSVRSLMSAKKMDLEKSLTNLVGCQDAFCIIIIIRSLSPRLSLVRFGSPERETVQTSDRTFIQENERSSSSLSSVDLTRFFTFLTTHSWWWW